MFPPGGAGPSTKAPRGPDVAQLMALMPTILKYGAKLPGFLVGYVAAFVVVLLFVGLDGMKRWTGDGGTFGADLVALLLFPIVLREWRAASAQRVAAKMARRRVDDIAADAKLADADPLD